MALTMSNTKTTIKGSLKNITRRMVQRNRKLGHVEGGGNNLISVKIVVEGGEQEAIIKTIKTITTPNMAPNQNRLLMNNNNK
jgi:hypothetical protein